MLRHKLLVISLFALACKGRDGAADMGMEDERSVSRSVYFSAAAPEPDFAVGGEAMPAASFDEGKMGKAERQQRGRGVGMGAGRLDDVSKNRMKDTKRDIEQDEDGQGGPGGGGGGETVTRSWFPETFLFEPLVVTDGSGEAVVPVKVPDRLTTWRVLALAHARNGAQGGATTSFLGTLPTYVDPVIPPFLAVGDRVRLPIQLVNTTEAPVTAKLETAIENATLAGATGVKTVPAQGSVVDYAELVATKAGQIRLGVKLGGTDAVVHTIDVVPTGKPVTVTRSGTLAAPRTLSITGPAGSDPTTDRARLLVYPGALALLRSELSVSTARAGVAEDAYALLLAGRAPDLLAALGDKPDASALRDLAVLTAQRAIRHARTLDVTRATLIAEAALAHRDNPVLARLGERAVEYLARNQRPDGTFSGATGWTLQRVLVATADGTRAAAADLSTAPARQRAQAVRARAAGAFARTLDQVTDPYTAAAILASGAATDELATTLRERVRAGIEASEDGAKYLAVPADVVRADGAIPSRAEATALAVLALAGTPDAPLADLGTTLLGAYTPGWGWSDGVANLACMRAVLELFKTPLPDAVTITLSLDGTPVATGRFAGDKLKDVLALDVPAIAGGIAGAHQWSITAEPAMPGLGYALALHAWLPWDKQATTGGLELALPGKLAGTVGKPIDIALTAIAPSGMPVHLRHALPAGVQPDRPSLEALVDAGRLERFEIADGKVDLHLVPLQPGQTFTATYKVIPTLAGTLRSQASSIQAGTTTFHVPPTEWTIR
jgi:hypothetical protein